MDKNFSDGFNGSGTYSSKASASGTSASVYEAFEINDRFPKSKYDKRKKKPKTLLNVVFSQKATIILMLLLQFLQIFLAFTFLSENYTYVDVLFSTISVLLVIHLMNTDQNPAYKLAWIVPLIIFPVFTTVIYMLLTNQPGTLKIKKLYAQKCADTRKFLQGSEKLSQKIKEQDPELYKLSNYLEHTAGFPAYECADAEYFPLGEYKFSAMIQKLRTAEKFILMEYFIVDDGEMWGELLDILLDRAKAGVEIKFLCDGMGSQFTLPSKDIKAMRDAGIQVKIFNRFRPMISTIQNNRDHRKILVIDGKTGFCGGINIADEYINRRVRFGHWKDTAVMITGKAVWNFTMMFFQMWEIDSKDSASADYESYKADCDETGDRGYVIPYGDSPLDEEKVGKLVYLHIINSAKDYVYITTPYFIPDQEMLTALELAAKSGVDIRIVTPHVPDKWYIHCITRSYYRELLGMGVKVYEYVPGFVHAKNFLSDDSKAVVGTINLDYRSLYLHFECAAYMQDTSCIKDIKADFEELFSKSCHRITDDDCKKISFFSRFASVILRMLGPLL